MQTNAHHYRQSARVMHTKHKTKAIPVRSTCKPSKANVKRYNHVVYACVPMCVCVCVCVYAVHISPPTKLMQLFVGWNTCAGSTCTMFLKSKTFSAQARHLVKLLAQLADSPPVRQCRSNTFWSSFLR